MFRPRVLNPRERIEKAERYAAQIEAQHDPQPIIEDSLKPYVDALVSNGLGATDEVLYVLQIGYVPYNADIMDSFLIIGTPVPAITEITGTPGDVVDIYSRLFFDSRVFKGNRIFKSQYIDSLPDTEDEERARKEMLTMSWKLGLNYIKFTLGHKDNIDIPSHVRDLFVLAYYNTYVYSLIPWREDSQASAGWAKQSVMLANMAEKKKQAFDMEYLHTKLTSEEFREDHYPEEEYFT